MIGQTIGSYKILTRIGEGGMGTVYRGLDLMLDRAVAIKALRADLAGNTDLVDRFKLEAKAVARLQHVNVASVYALQREGDHFYLVMEFIEGETLEDRLRRAGRLHPSDAVPLMAQALAGLAHAHAQGVVHRDIKPANLMITPQGTVKIMDFGIARVLGGQRMTRTRFAVGTAEYMAPEQVKGSEVDGRTDLYALGIVLYEALTGQVPFRRESEFELMRAQVEEAPPRLRSRLDDAPDALDDALDRALAKAPDDRFPDAAAFRRALLDVPLPDKPAVAPTRVHTPTPAPPSLPPADARPAAATRVASSDEATRRTAPVAATRLVTPDDAFAPAAPSEPEASSSLLRRPAVWGSAVAASVMLLVLALVLRPGASTPASNEAPAEPEVVQTSPGHSPAFVPAQPAPSAPLPAAPSPDAGGVASAMLLASAERFYVRDHLTSPRDSNAADVVARVLAMEPANTQARSLVRRIVERYQRWGAAQVQRARYSQALRYYQTALDVANRFPTVAGDLAPPIQRSLQTASAQAAAGRDIKDAADASADAVDRAGNDSRPAPSEARTGRVRIVVRPYGSVFVDGKRVATDTFDAIELTLPEGPHTVRVTHPTLGATERRVTVRAGALEDVLIRLTN